jgi:CysZ protein
VNGMTGFFHGLFAPLYGVRRLMVDKRLRTLSILPLLIALIAGSLMTIAGLYGLSRVIGSIAMTLGGLVGFDPDGFMNLAIMILLWPIGLLVLGVGVYMGIRIIAAPFYSYLAERALVSMGTCQDSNFNLRSLPQWLWVTLRMLMVSLLKAVIFAVASILLFVLSMVPVLNVVAALGFMHMIAFDISDYSFEAMGWTLERRFQHVREHAMAYTGLACGLGLAMAIPGLNLVLLPAAVIGASETLHRTLDRQTIVGNR